jgi:hypothetical protein
MEYCCFGMNMRERDIVTHEIKEDALPLTKEELEHLRNFILVPRDRYSSCC